MKPAVIALVLISLSLPIRAQEKSADSSRTLDVCPILPSIAPVAVIGVALANNYNDFWRNSSPVPFHFSNDPPYAMHNDKLGHAFYASTTADIITRCYVEAGLDAKTSGWIGFGASLLAQTLVEIGDGVHGKEAYYGFSPGDEIADFLGSGFSMMKEYLPALKSIDYKIGFSPSDALKSGAYHSIIDDDESQFFWLSTSPAPLMPAWYPQWLNVAVGYGVENLEQVKFLSSRAGTIPKSQFYLGFDISLKAIPIKGKVWEIIAEILDHFRIPFPALQLYPITKWYWIHS
ncbi:MAG: hypothetical protein WCH46_05145 [bacterium]